MRKTIEETLSALVDESASDFVGAGRLGAGAGSVEKVGVRALAAPVSDIRNQLIS